MKVVLVSLVACLMFQVTSFAAPKEPTQEQPKQEESVKRPQMESTPLVPKEEKTQTTTADERSDLTKEEASRTHAQMVEKMKEMQAKFDALTDEQKKEIYDLYDKINVSKVKLLDKYVEFGLVTEQQANAIRQSLGQYAQDIRNEKQFLGLMEILPVKGNPTEQLKERAKALTDQPETTTESLESGALLNEGSLQYDQMMKQLKQMQTQFSALTDEQREQFYTIYDEIMMNQVKLLEKYVEFGLMEKDQATAVSEKLMEHAKSMRENKQLIGLHARLMHHKRQKQAK